MLDFQYIFCFTSFLFLACWFFENSTSRKVTAQLNAAKVSFTAQLAQLNEQISEKNNTLATEYLNKKKLIDVFDAVKLDADSAKARMVQLNDALNTSREELEIAKSDVQDLTEEQKRLNSLIESGKAAEAGYRVRVVALEGALTLANERAANAAAKVSLKRARKTAAKSKKKRA